MTPQERRAYLLVHYAHTRNSELAKLAGVSVQTILKDSRLLGLYKAKKAAAPKLNRLGKTNKKWTPALEEICELMYPVMTNAKLAELVGISISVVGRFCLNKKYVKDRAALDRSKPRRGITKTPRADPTTKVNLQQGITYPNGMPDRARRMFDQSAWTPPDLSYRGQSPRR